MKFLTVVNFAPTFNEDVTIVGFQVSPFKEIKLKGKVVETVQCAEEEAQLYSLHAVTAEPPQQWVADFKTRDEADQFALLLQAIVRSAVNNRPAETEEETSAFGFNVDDVLKQANEDLQYLTEHDAAQVLMLMLNKADVSIGISWETITDFTSRYKTEHKLPQFPTYCDEELGKLKEVDGDYQLTDHFRWIPKTEAKADGNCYAIDLRDGSDFLIDDSHELQGLIDSADFVFATHHNW